MLGPRNRGNRRGTGFMQGWPSAQQPQPTGFTGPQLSSSVQNMIQGNQANRDEAAAHTAMANEFSANEKAKQDAIIARRLASGGLAPRNAAEESVVKNIQATRARTAALEAAAAEKAAQNAKLDPSGEKTVAPTATKTLRSTASGNPPLFSEFAEVTGLGDYIDKKNEETAFPTPQWTEGWSENIGDFLGDAASGIADWFNIAGEGGSGGIGTTVIGGGAPTVPPEIDLNATEFGGNGVVGGLPSSGSIQNSQPVEYDRTLDEYTNFMDYPVGSPEANEIWRSTLPNGTNPVELLRYNLEQNANIAVPSNITPKNVSKYITPQQMRNLPLNTKRLLESFIASKA